MRGTGRDCLIAQGVFMSEFNFGGHNSPWFGITREDYFSGDNFSDLVPAGWNRVRFGALTCKRARNFCFPPRTGFGVERVFFQGVHEGCKFFRLKVNGKFATGFG